MKLKILLDTNFLLIPFQFKVDIFSELDRICDFPYDLYILDKSLEELDQLAKKGKAKEYAKPAKILVKKQHIKVIKTKTKQHTDDVIAQLKGYIIATRDNAFIKKIKKDHKIITLRQKSHLVFI